MRIGIDLRFTASSHMGTGGYAETAALGLADALGPDDSIVALSEAERLDSPLSDRVRHVRVPTGLGGADRDLGERLLWDSSIARAELDVFFAPTGIAPLVKTGPVVITIHDLLFEHEPDCFTPPLYKLLKREIPRSVEAADRIVAVSEFTRRDLTATYGVPEGRISVVRQGLRGIFSGVPKKRDIQAALKRLGIRQPYLLALSNHAPHKNTPFAIEVFARWVKQSGGARHSLVLAGGGPAPQAPTDLRAVIERHGLGGRVTILGRVEDADLPSLYAGASVFLFPSLYEGWGLPPLEAIAMETPVIVSDRGALPEAVGEAGLVLPVDDPRPWVDGIEGILSNGVRERLLSAMRARRETLFDSGGNALRELLEEACQVAPTNSKPATPLVMPHAAPLSVIYRADWESPSGFAAAARVQAFALESAGVAILRDETRRDANRLTGLRLPGRTRVANNGAAEPEIVIHQGSPDDMAPVNGKYNIGFFEWETDRIPGDDSRGERYNWVKVLNALDEVWGASEWTKEVLSRSGIHRPSRVFGHPIDTAFYSPGPRRPQAISFPARFDPTWTVFLYVGTWDVRKWPDDVIRAYLRTFQRGDRVLLIVKTYPTGAPDDRPEEVASTLAQIRESMRLSEEEAPAVCALSELWPPEQVRDLYRSAHAFVTATRGEGFGLCAVEAMACGLPVISTRFSAMSDYLTEDTGYPVPHRVEHLPSRLVFPWFREDQRWGVPDLGALGAAMRRVHENRREAREKGRRARTVVEARYAPPAIGRAMLARLKEIEEARRGHSKA